MPMLTVEEAYAVLQGNARRITETEEVALDDAVGRVLAEDIHSGIAVPSADNSAMDGYAFRYADAAEGLVLTVSQRIPAGSHGHQLHPGEAARIFTGAPIPEGADTVVRQEWCTVQDGRLIFSQMPGQGDAVRHAGEDIQKGALVLKTGTLLQAQHLGLVASIGRTTMAVLRRLRVALLVTGSELTEPGEALSPGKIYNSNQALLKTLLKGLGCVVTAYGIVPDDLEVTRAKLTEAAQGHDFILTSGGVSVGEEDHIRPVIQQEGTIHFWRIAVKPGKPVVYGELKSLQGTSGVPVIGLPGNPVSVFVTFLLFVRPFLLKMQGVDASLPSGFWLKSADAYASSDDRREFLRARLNQDNEVELYPNQSSGVLSSMVWGDGLVDNPAGNPIRKGDLVRFIPFSAFFHL